jgi:hypothetical protein
MIYRVRFDQNMILCCPICNCLGYCAGGLRSSLKVLPDRSFNEIDSSAKQGCWFCDLAVQSFMMLLRVESEPRVELLVYPDSPTEIHSISGNLPGDVLEIYPCSSTHTPVIPIWSIAMANSRRVSEGCVTMVESRHGCAATLDSVSIDEISPESIYFMHF